jgi:Immunity protein Imm1
MVVKFFDRQDKHNPLNGSEIATSAALLKAIDEWRNRRPFFCELLGNNGYKLLIGIDSELGCVQYSSSDGDPPYLVATTEQETENDTEIEFFIDDTSTPILRRYCIPFDLMKRVVASFIDTGLRDPTVHWKEI